MGNKIAEVRRQKGITQSQLAELVKMNRTYLSLLETGKERPSIAMLERIAAALGVSLKDLL